MLKAFNLLVFLNLCLERLLLRVRTLTGGSGQYTYNKVCFVSGLNVEVVMGGLPIEEDIAKFQKKVHILVGSPGRMRHLIQKKHIDVSAVRLLVLDEADKLMDRSFKADINYIFSNLPKQKQVIMSSATYPDTLKEILQNYVQKAQHICPDSTNILLGIKQFATTVKSNVNIVVQTQNRFEELLNILSSIEFKQCLIFCNYQVRVGELCSMLVQKKWPADKLHGQLEQTERLGALKTLKEYKCRILVSTDLAARGIDASNVNLVINFEPPCDWQTYLHRIGRAGRFGSYGIAISIVSEGKELEKFQELIKTISQSLKINYLSNGKELSDYDKIVESRENEMSQILDLGGVGKTPPIDEVTKTPSVKDNHNSTINQMTKTLQVKTSCETSDIVDNKCKTPETGKDTSDIIKHQMLEVSNLEDKKFIKEIFTNNSNNFNIKIEKQLSEILEHQMLELSNVEEIKIQSFNDLMESFKMCEQKSNDSFTNQDKTTTTVTVESKKTDNHIPFNSSKESCAKTLVENKVPEKINGLAKSSKIYQCGSSLAVTTQDDTIKVVNEKSKTTDDHTLSNSNEKSCAKTLISNDAPEQIKLESFNDLIEFFKVQTLESNDAIEFQDESFNAIIEKTKTTYDNTLLNSNEESSAKTLISNEAPEQIKLQSFTNPINSFKVHELKSNDTIVIQNDTFKPVNEKRKTVDEHTFLNSEASPTSNGDDGYNTNSCLHSRSTKNMQLQIKRNNDVKRSSKISNKDMETTRFDINTTYNNWYRQFKACMQQIEMLLYIEELSKM